MFITQAQFFVCLGFAWGMLSAWAVITGFTHHD